MKLSYSSVILMLLVSLAACSENQPDNEAAPDTVPGEIGAAAEPFKLSLAQWSLHKRYMDEGGDPYQFAAHAKEMGFDGIEYVSVIYGDDFEEGEGYAASVKTVFDSLHRIADSVGIEEVLIMVDAQGELADLNEPDRKSAVSKHQLFVDVAARSGIPTIRVNAGGEQLRTVASAAEARAQAVKSLRALGEYAAATGDGVNVVVENHGGYSSDPAWLRDVMAEVALDNVGILPDFGNWCRRRVDPKVWEKGCEDELSADSIYAAVGMWMPYAHAVSAKSYAFDDAGNETKIDYVRMLDTVMARGYDGFVGVEYEGEAPEPEGIAATRDLLRGQMR